MENIYLIGMPGSGKSKLGEEAAKQLGLTFVDTDEVTIKEAGVKDMNELFGIKGVANFRKMEKQVIRDLSKKQDLLVSTGGGAILDAENTSVMVNTGRVVFIDVNLPTLQKRIDVNDRPLVKDIDSALESLYFHRLDMYKRAATDTFDNNGGLEESVEAFVNMVKGW
ncbi:MAG: hypothetical protein IJR47_02075 [Clostridia bacterium]|nr:hypothetical protein [Clostridia bacterium]